MGQCQTVDPAASGKLILPIQPHHRPGTTLNSLGKCLKIIDTVRGSYPGARGEDPASGSAVRSR
jgi:hypothetical protein